MNKEVKEPVVVWGGDGARLISTMEYISLDAGAGYTDPLLMKVISKNVDLESKTIIINGYLFNLKSVDKGVKALSNLSLFESKDFSVKIRIEDIYLIYDMDQEQFIARLNQLKEEAINKIQESFKLSCEKMLRKLRY